MDSGRHQNCTEVDSNLGSEAKSLTPYPLGQVRLQEKSFREKEDEELQHNYQNIVDDEYSDVNSTSFSEIKSE